MANNSRMFCKSIVKVLFKWKRLYLSWQFKWGPHLLASWYHCCFFKTKHCRPLAVLSTWCECKGKGIAVCNDVFILFTVTLYGVFTNNGCMGVSTRCLLLELLDVSVSDLLVRGCSGNQGGRWVVDFFFRWPWLWQSTNVLVELNHVQISEMVLHAAYKAFSA